MPGTTIDELVIKIALDATGLKKGQTEVEGRLKTIKEKMEDTGKAAEPAGKRMAEFFNGARDSALGLIAALTGTAGLVKALADAAKNLTQFGNAAAGIGIDVSKLSAIELAIARIGGSAEATAAALASGARRMVQASFGNDADYSVFLGLIGGTFSDKQDTVLQKLAAFADANREKGQQFFNAIAEKGGYGALENELWKGLTQYNADLAHEAPFAITPEQVKTAQEFYGAWNDLINAFETANRKFETAIMPWLKPLIEDLAQFIEKEPDAAIAIEGLAAAIGLLVASSVLTGLASLASGIGAVSAAILGSSGLVAAFGALATLHGDTPDGPQPTETWPQDVTNWFRRQFGLPPIVRNAGTPGPVTVAANMNLSPDERALLDAIAGGEQNANGYASQNPHSSAYGRYQFVDATRNRLLTDMGLPLDTPLTNELQDRMALRLAKEAGWKPGMSPEQTAAILNKIWPSLPGGSQQNTTPAQFAARLQQASLAEASRTRPVPTPAPKPAGPRTPASAPGQSVPSWLPDWYQNMWQHHYPQTSSANSDNSVTIAADIHVHTQATDAPGIAASFKQALRDQYLIEQSDRTLA